MLATLDNPASLAIDETLIRQYEAEGAICLRGVIDPHWITLLRTATDEVLAGERMDMSTKGEKGTFVGDLNMWTKNDLFRQFAFESPSWLIAKTLMRATAVRLFSDQLFVKAPGTQTPSPWHHDQTYWPVLGESVCSVWVTMDPVTVATSGLEYIKGSHRWGRRFNPADFGARSLSMLHDAANEAMPDIDARRGDYEFLSWDMEPGDCLVHHSLAVHGAGGNKSSVLQRRAIATRWFGDDAYYRPSGMFTPEMVGLEPGARMTSAMFPVVPGLEKESASF